MTVLVVETCDVVSVSVADVDVALSESDGALVVVISGTARNKE